jgi:hypothetical protein
MDRQRFLELIEPAVALVARKGEDYNANAIQLHEYFPFKDKSYQQMLHMKVLRMRSLLDKGSEPNFDSLLDSVYDLVNYAVFYLDYLQPTDKVIPPTEIKTMGLNKAWRETGHE